MTLDEETLVRAVAAKATHGSIGAAAAVPALVCVARGLLQAGDEELHDD